MLETIPNIYISLQIQPPICVQAFRPNQLQLLSQPSLSCVLILKSYGNSEMGMGQEFNYMQDPLMLCNVKQN
jgi:hypothetical protein